MRYPLTPWRIRSLVPKTGLAGERSLGHETCDEGGRVSRIIPHVDLCTRHRRLCPEAPSFLRLGVQPCRAASAQGIEDLAGNRQRLRLLGGGGQVCGSERLR